MRTIRLAVISFMVALTWLLVGCASTTPAAGPPRHGPGWTPWAPQWMGDLLGWTA